MAKRHFRIKASLSNVDIIFWFRSPIFRMLQPSGLQSIDHHMTVLADVKKNWMEWMVTGKPSFKGIIIASQSILSACKESAAVHIEDFITICSLVHDELGIHLDALVNVFLQLTTVGATGSISSLNTSFDVIQEKHGELCVLMDEQDCEQLCDVKTEAAEFLPTEDSQTAEGEGMRLFVQHKDGDSIIVLEDLFESERKYE